MGQRAIGCEPYLLYQIGFQPSDLIEMKICSKSTAYKYWRKFEAAKKNIPKLIKKG